LFLLRAIVCKNRADRDTSSHRFFSFLDMLVVMVKKYDSQNIFQKFRPGRPLQGAIENDDFCNNEFLATLTPSAAAVTSNNFTFLYFSLRPVPC